MPPEDERAYAETAIFKQQLAERVGLPTRPTREAYDIVIVGAGPAGLTAALYGASEGHTTLVVEAIAPGGQAGTSARIENRIQLTGGPLVDARSAVAATGVQYRRHEAPGVEDLIGAGVHYGSAPGEAVRLKGADVVVVGGGNSAGQAALHLAEHARIVTVVIRSSGIERGMSNYLVERIAQHPRIAVRPSTQVAEARGDSRLTSVALRGATGQTEELAADAMFLLIGAQPVTAGVEGWLRRDSHGFLLTGQDVVADGARAEWWRLERDPYPLESSAPGVFVAGDLRHGSIKRVASAVGEGAMAISLIGRFLGQER